MRKKYKKWKKNPFDMGRNNNWRYFNLDRVPIHKESAAPSEILWVS